MCHLETKVLLGDIACTQGHAALASIGNAEHDAQLQLAHQVIAPVTFEDMLPGLRQARVYPPIWQLA